MNIKKFCLAFALTVAFALSAYAGDISTGIASAPPRTSVAANGDISTGIAGQIEIPVANGVISTTAPTSDSVLQAALNLLRGVMALL
jgi:hypothetical protein